MLVLLFAGLCHPQISAEPSSSPPDYSKAVDLLIELGFPDSKNAKYVNINSPTLSNRNSHTYYSDDSTPPPTLKGNAWLKPKAENQKLPLAILLNGTTRSFKKSSSAGYTADNQPIEGQSKDVDILKDIASIKKWVDSSSSDYTESHSWSYRGAPLFTQYFLLACQAHRAGHTKAANDLIASLLTSVSSPEELVDAAISAIADLKLNEVTANFNKTSDWKQYHTDLENLLKTFPRGWRKRYSLAILIPKVKQRATNAPAPIPSIPNHTFSPEILELLKQTAKDGQTISSPSRSYSNSGQTIWILSNDKTSTTGSAFLQLTNHGMDGFIALTSLLGDDTLITANNPSSSYSYSSSNFYSSSGVSDSEMALRLYDSMDRPKSRGEYAKIFISQCIPSLADNSNYSSEELSTEDIRQMALEFWKEHRNDTKLQLTKFYLSNGSDRMIAQVATSLIEQSSPEALELFEQAVLSSEAPSAYAAQAKSYTIKRRAKAKDFIEKYKKALITELGTEKLEDYENQGQYQIREDGGVEKFIAKLLRYTEGLKPAQLLTKLARKDADVEEILEQLQPALADKPLGNLRAKFAYAIAKAEPQKAYEILYFLYELETPSPATPGLTPPPSKFEIEDWLKILNTKDPAPHLPLAGTAALLIEAWSEPDFDSENLPIFQTMETAKAYDIFIKRSIARLSKEPIPKIPSKDDLSEEELNSLVKKITDSPAPKIPALLEDLTTSEQLAFNDYIKNNEPPKSYLELGKLITKISTQHLRDPKSADPVKQALKPLLGQPYDENTYTSLIKSLSKQHGIFAGTALTITKERGSLGYSIMIIDAAPYKPRFTSLKKLDQLIRDKKQTHYVAISTSLRDLEAPFLTAHSDDGLNQEDQDKLTAAFKDAPEGSFQTMIIIEDAARLAIVDKERDANKGERDAIIKEIKEAAGDNLPESLDLEQFDLETLKQIQSQF